MTRTALILTAFLLAGCGTLKPTDTASHERTASQPNAVPGQPGGPFVEQPGVRGAI